jgi:hypothetical protein
MMEENLRRALLLSRGDWSVFVTRPLSAGLLAGAALLLVVLLPAVKNKREEAFVPACRCLRATSCSTSHPLAAQAGCACCSRAAMRWMPPWPPPPP